MKKLFLLAILLGLTGCGDNNQSDTTQTTTQANTLQKAEASPAVANYSLAAAPRTFGAVAPLAGWGITKTSVMGASTLIDAAKGSMTSAALITPNAKQVAEVLRGGAAGIALSLAVDQLLDAIDWVLDPANSRIIYHEKPEESGLYNYTLDRGGNTFRDITPQGVCQKLATWLTTLPDYPKATYKGVKFIEKNVYRGTIIYDCLIDTTGNGRVTATGPAIGKLNPDYINQEKYLSLETVAEQVISNADAGSLDAQVATNIAAQNILNDVVQAEPVVQELENNADDKCPSGIIKNGSCWVCERDQYYPMSRATRDAKTATRGKSCKDVTDTAIKTANAALFRNLINARIQENACWSPPDPNHAIALVDAQNALSLCEN